MKTVLQEIPVKEKTATPSKKATAALLNIKTILVPMDFSRASAIAVTYAVSIAQKFGAAIHLLHVMAEDESARAGTAHLMRETGESIEFLSEKLRKVHQEHVPSFWPKNCHVLTGRPYQEICRQAREINADLIVLGTRGNTGLTRVLLGSTAERVVRFAPCPVYVARSAQLEADPDAKPRFSGDDVTIRQILVPTDFSQCAMAGLMYGALWAKAFDAKLRLLFVLFPAAPVLVDRIAMNLPTDAMTAPADTRLEMEALAQIDILKGVKCEPKIRFGYATDTICAEADDADLVVISTHGRSGFKHALMGSVAEQVVRYARCSVLAVPGQPHEYMK